MGFKGGYMASGTRKRNLDNMGLSKKMRWRKYFLIFIGVPDYR